MGSANALTEAEKTTIIIKSGKSTSPVAIAQMLSRHVKTIQRFLIDLLPRKCRNNKGIRKVISTLELRNVKRQLFIQESWKCQTIFSNVGVTNMSKTTRNRVLQTMATVKSPEIKPPLTPRHVQMRQESATTYTKLEMKYIMFTDETRATLGGLDGWCRGWVDRAKNDTNVFAANKVVAV